MEARIASSTASSTPAPPSEHAAQRFSFGGLRREHSTELPVCPAPAMVLPSDTCVPMSRWEKSGGVKSGACARASIRQRVVTLLVDEERAPARHAFSAEEPVFAEPHLDSESVVPRPAVFRADPDSGGAPPALPEPWAAEVRPRGFTVWPIPQAGGPAAISRHG